ncbi:MAG: LysM peptidoglycan-binding domain-containing protein [Pseudomonadota bacterium]
MRRLQWAMNAAWALLAICALGGLPCAAIAAESVVPRPPELERDVQFWIRVYTQVTTNEGFLHDEHNLGVVYETVKFALDSSTRQRREQLDSLRDRIEASLRRLQSGSTEHTADDERIRAMFGGEASAARFAQASGEIRFQLGQSDRFRAGLVRSGAWEAHIADTLANLGLPPEIAALPHVESSFDPTAYSKVGAAGLWQFMRSTGRRFLRIDDAVDERMDPFRATEAAAQLLDFNYRFLGTWPLAVTAYNHGAAGMRRARDATGTTDIARIVREHKSPLFGFASRNFYVCFLAALEIDRNPEKYFGPLERRSEVHFREVSLPSYVPVTALERLLKVDRAHLEDLNPALRPTVWKGQRLIPRGYKLRLPVDAGEWTTEQLAARLGAKEQFAGQPKPRSYKVRGGDTLASIARQQSVSVDDLAALNNLKASAKLKAGRTVLLPETGPVLASTTAPVAVAAAASKAAQQTYVVRSGDALTDIATRVGVPLATLISLNQIKNPDSVYEGQRLRLSAEGEPTPDTVVANVAASSPAVAAAATQALLSDKKAETREAERGTVAQVSDPVEYGVAADGSIRVAAAETLGHYADWLGLSASQLRVLNSMRAGSTVIIGRPVKLAFDKVTREQFETKRRDYHQQLQAVFFTGHRIVGTEVYVARKGDSLWAVTKRYASLPVWLLQQYNPDLDFADLRSGTQIVVPRVEDVPVV